MTGDGARSGPESGGGRPASWAEGAKLVETHVSTLFFVGDRVYKLRKPVQFGFLDFRLRSSRQADCEREVVLNRRLAPDVYVGVADVVMDGEPIDHMVVMRRMPDERRLAALARRKDDLDPWLHRVAERMATFHEGADRSPAISADATDQALSAAWLDSFEETAPFVGTLLEEGTEAEIRALVPRWISGRKPLLAHRIASGRVCDGHGDLQAEDIFCLDDGVRILDCIEFSDRLRHCDVCADVSFLAIDLERLGRPEEAARFILDYQLRTGDTFPDTLVQHYSGSRAYVRAKVACLRSAQSPDQEGARSEARRMQALALDHLRQARMRLVLIGGIPGSGKSTLAAGVADETGWEKLSSDEIRRTITEPAPGPDAPTVPVARYIEGRYRPEVSTAVYRELLRQAEELLGLGVSVVLDASWVDSTWRDAARSAADRTFSDLVEMRCDTPLREAADRVSRRLSEHTGLSEATPEISAAMSASMDPWPTASVIDTSTLTPPEAVERAVDLLFR